MFPWSSNSDEDIEREVSVNMDQILNSNYIEQIRMSSQRILVCEFEFLFFFFPFIAWFHQELLNDDPELVSPLIVGEYCEAFQKEGCDEELLQVFYDTLRFLVFMPEIQNAEDLISTNIQAILSV